MDVNILWMIPVLILGYRACYFEEVTKPNRKKNVRYYIKNFNGEFVICRGRR